MTVNPLVLRKSQVANSLTLPQLCYSVHRTIEREPYTGKELSVNKNR